MTRLFVRHLQILPILLYCFLSNSVNAQSFSKQELSKFDDYINTAMQQWKVPGLALAIVNDTGIILCKGYGVCDVNTKKPVDQHTNFAIASNTKSFTSVMMAMLSEKEGGISLDDKVVDYLPYFRLYDPWVTQQMTIRDLLCHRVGFETFAGDLLWYASQYSREEVIKRAALIKPSYGFRAHYGYSNIMFIAAGEIIGKINDGKGWDKSLKELILNPLQMDRTISSVNNLEGMGNYASPHTEYQGATIAIPWLNWDNIGGAGAIISNAEDMSHWLQFLINRGVYQKKQLVSVAKLEELWTPHINNPSPYNPNSYFPSTHFKSYGLGFSLFDYLGAKIIGHNGGYDGMISQTIVIPEKKLGFVLMTNANSSLYYALQYRILDFLLGGKETDWCGIFYKRIADMDKEKQEAEHQFDLDRIPNTKPSLSLQSYCGNYQSPLYGAAVIELVHDTLQLKFTPSPLFHSSLLHYHYDTFVVEFSEFPSLPRGTVTFSLTASGSVGGMRIFIDNPDFDFTELDFTKE